MLKPLHMLLLHADTCRRRRLPDMLFAGRTMRHVLRWRS